MRADALLDHTDIEGCAAWKRIVAANELRDVDARGTGPIDRGLTAGDRQAREWWARLRPLALDEQGA